MFAKKWGFIPFIVATLSSVIFFILQQWTAIFSNFQIAENYLSVFSPMMKFFGVLFGVLTILIGCFSYKRVLNSKIYIITILSGICTLFYFFISFFNLIDLSYFYYTFAFFIVTNILLFSILKSFDTYEKTSLFTIIFSSIESVLLIVALLVSIFKPLNQLSCENSFRLGMSLFLILYSLLSMVAVGIYSYVKEDENNFHLGGILTSFSVVSCLVTISLSLFPNPIFTSSFIILILFYEAFILIGTGIFWSTKVDNKVSYDPLLKIFNRQYCFQILDEKVKLNTNPPFTVAMIDIDHFKNVNDTYGHKAGDDVLVTVAQTLVKECKNDGGIVCRYGGEEILLFFSQKNAQMVQAIMEKIRLAVEAVTTVSNKQKIKVTISAGICCRDNKDYDLYKVQQTADKALYVAKDSGRNCVKVAKLSGKIVSEKEKSTKKPASKSKETKTTAKTKK